MTAVNDYGVVTEDATLTVTNGESQNLSGSYDTHDEHSGDVIHTSNTSSYDTDADSDTLTVSAVRTGSTEGSGTVGSVGSALTGTYGPVSYTHLTLPVSYTHLTLPTILLV